MNTQSEATGAYDMLDRIVAEYIQATETGRSPDRAELLARHPDLAARLRSFFLDFDRLGKQASAFHLPGPDETASAGGPGRADLPSVRYLGDYELETEIARGGMGAVFRARQVSLNRPVAVKLILAGTYATPAAIQQFRREAEAAANLEHPNILPIYEVGENDGHQYFSMKLIEGGSLADRSDDYRSNPQAIASLVSTLARAVHYAHQRGIIHRDLKPANILLDRDGTPSITDFGLAKRVDADDGATRTGTILGTPSYMAPEQAKGEKGLTTAVDVYSLGAILYELLTGRPPFRAETVFTTVKEVIEREPDDPRVHNPAADRDLGVIALKCLSKDRERRYESAADLAEDLDRWARGEPTIARPPGSFELALRWMRRNLATIGSVTATGVLCGLVATYAPFALIRNSIPVLLPPDTPLMNPLRILNLAQTEPAVRYSFLAAASVLILFGGWFVRGMVRPRSSTAAMASAAAVGLITLFVAFAILSPMMVSQRITLRELYLHPIQPLDEIFESGLSEQSLGWTTVPPKDAEYLRQYLAPEELTLDARGQKRALENLQRQALDANRAAVGLIIGWVMLVFLFMFIMTWAVHSAWCADYLIQSRRSMAGKLAIYFELHLPVLAWVVFVLIAIGVTITMQFQNVIGGPLWASRLIPTLGGLGWIVSTHIGVLRRWPIWQRVVAVLGWFAASAGLMHLMGALL
ncbi:MAG: serine/threonine protein kinase [Gemmataceae bacterium]|nr:serine/threonine protein kinase [Gemmataceae bacterium]